MSKSVIAALLLANTHPIIEIGELKDGDTAPVEIRLTVAAKIIYDPAMRVYGIDTPEKGRRAQCDEELWRSVISTYAAQTWVMKAKHLRVTHLKKDKFSGRAVGIVLNQNDESWGDFMLSNGLAQEFFNRGPKKSWCNGNLPKITYDYGQDDDE